MFVQESEFAILMLASASIGGAWGARRSGQQAWKGFVIILTALIGTAATLFAASSSNIVIGYVLTLVIAGALGGALKMTGRQIGLVVLGATLVLVVITAVVEFLGA